MHKALTHIFSLVIPHSHTFGTRKRHQQQQQQKKTHETIEITRTLRPTIYRDGEIRVMQKDLQHFAHSSIQHYLLSVTALMCDSRAVVWESCVVHRHTQQSSTVAQCICNNDDDDDGCESTHSRAFISAA